MFWPLVLPAKMTSWLLAALILIATIAAPRFRKKRGRVFAWSILLVLTLFIPACIAIQAAEARP